MLDKMMNQIERSLGWFLAALMILMVVDVTWQVFTRFLLGEPSSFTEEVARFLLIWIGVLGAAYAFRKHAHLGLDILTSKLAADKQRRAKQVSNACCLAFAVLVFVYGGAKLVALTLELRQTSPALGVPMGYVYTVLPISGVLLSLFALDNIRHASLVEFEQSTESGLPVD